MSLKIETFYETRKNLFDICGNLINKDKYQFINILSEYLKDIVNSIDSEIQKTTRNSMINWKEKKNPKLLSKIINNDDKIILCCDNDNINNSVIMIEKNNIIMYNILIECVNNILNKNKGNNKYQTSGNELFNKHFKNINNDYKKIFKIADNIYYDNNLIINCFYKNYYINYYNTEKDLEYMWINNKYFYNKANTIKNNDFEYNFYYITEKNNIYNNLIITWEKNNIFKINNIENNNNFYIKLKVIDNIKNNIKYIDIGILVNNEKYFIIE